MERVWKEGDWILESNAVGDVYQIMSLKDPFHKKGEMISNIILALEGDAV